MRLVRSVTGLCKSSLFLLLPFEIIEKIKTEKRLTLLTLSCFLATEGKYRRGQSVLADTRPPICYNVIKNSQYINKKGETLNWSKISEMSLMILVCMHIFCWQAHLLKKGHFVRYNHPHILCMCSKSL